MSGPTFHKDRRTGRIEENPFPSSLTRKGPHAGVCRFLTNKASEPQQGSRRVCKNLKRFKRKFKILGKLSKKEFHRLNHQLPGGHNVRLR